MSSNVVLSEETIKSLKNTKAIQERKHLVSIQKSICRIKFHKWGFTSWEFFKTIVLHFYPQVNERHLKEFYDGTVIREDVLKYVNYTYQILNV